MRTWMKKIGWRSALVAAVATATLWLGVSLGKAEAEMKPYQKTDLSQLKFPDKHPYVFYSPEEIALIRELAKQPGTFQQKQYQAYKGSADRMIVAPKPGEDQYFEWGDPSGIGRARLPKGSVPRVSPEGGAEAYPKGIFCPHDAARLVHTLLEDGTWEHKCPKCQAVVTGQEYDALARGVQNYFLGIVSRDLAWAYLIENDPRYAKAVRQILLGLAQYYPKWPGKMATHVLGEDQCLMGLVEAYDLLHESGIVSDAEKKQIEEGLFQPAGKFFSRFADTNGRLNNRGAVHNATVAAIGFVIKDKQLIDHVLNSPLSGFNSLLANCLDPDGIWDEGLNYHSYTLAYGLIPIAESAYRSGINLYENQDFQRMVLGPINLTTWPGSRPGGPGVNYGALFYLRLKDPMFAVGLEPGVVPGGCIPLWVTPEWKETPEIALSSKHYRGFGQVILRAGEGKGEMAVWVAYGPEALHMGHAPGLKFQLDLITYGLPYTMASASGSYSDAITGGFGRQPIAHSTLIVDELDQEPGVGAVDFFEDAPQAKVVRMVDSEQAYLGINLNRTLAMTDKYLVDLFQVSSSTHHRYDLPYRLFGDFRTDLPLQSTKSPVGWRYGYQYLINVRKAKTNNTWSGVWGLESLSADLPKKGLKLTMLPAETETETEVIVADSPGLKKKRAYTDGGAYLTEVMPTVIGRRWAKATTFASILEPFTGKPAVKKAEPLQVSAAGKSVRNGEAVGVRVKTADDTNYFLASYSPGERKYERMVLDGRMGIMSFSPRKSTPQYLHLIKGTKLKAATRSLMANRPATFWVQDLGEAEITIGMGTDSGGTISIQGRFRAKVKVIQGEREVLSQRLGRGQISFTAEAETTYRVFGVDGWSSVAMGVTTAPSLEITRSPRLLEAAKAHARIPSGVERDIYQLPAGVMPTGGKNLAINSGFEIVDEKSKAAPHWELGCSYYWHKYLPKHAYSTSEAHSGKRSLQLSEVNWYSRVTDDAYAIQTIPLGKSMGTLTLSAYVKANKPTQVRLCLLGYDPKWGWNSEGGISEEVEVGQDWSRLSITREFGPEIEAVRIAVKREHQEGGGDIWIDDVQLEQGEKATPYVSENR